MLNHFLQTRFNIVSYKSTIETGIDTLNGIFAFFVIELVSRLICESCKGEYGSCDEFIEYPIPSVTHLNKVFLSSDT